MLIVHSPRCLEYGAPGHPEGPERLQSTVALLLEQAHTWLVPEMCSPRDVLRVHEPSLVLALQRGEFFDPDTPVFPGIYQLARLSAGGAILAAEQALAGIPAFSLMRPPGHHAGRRQVMGFCYLNNLAIAVAKILASASRPSRGRPGPAPSRIAILDFDCHHGNGTEEIFHGDRRVLFASLHQSPCYPYTGQAPRDNCLNYPLPAGTGPREFLLAIDAALEHIRAFEPDLLAVSAGFDAYRNDPITHMGLEINTFYEVGLRLAAMPTRAFAVLEGGYSREVALCVEAFLDGWEHPRPTPSL